MSVKKNYVTSFLARINLCVLHGTLIATLVHDYYWKRLVIIKMGQTFSNI